VRANWTLAAVCGGWAIGAGGPAAAQEPAYRCGRNTYSERPCSAKVVNTEEYRAPAAKKGGGTFAARRLPGESDADFAVRSRRVKLKPMDQDECKRLDTKIPFEQERLKHSVTPEETAEATQSIEDSRKRYSKLGC
jgi:hypothetical protein